MLAVLAVHVVRRISEWIIYKGHEKKNPLGLMTQQPKFITVTRLIVSGVIFIIYFFAVGLILQELFAVNLTAYLASASIIGLAISFGSQGLVQDIVTGLTLFATPWTWRFGGNRRQRRCQRPRGDDRSALHRPRQFLQSAGYDSQPHHCQRQPVSVTVVWMPTAMSRFQAGADPQKAVHIVAGRCQRNAGAIRARLF